MSSSANGGSLNFADAVSSASTRAFGEGSAAGAAASLVVSSQEAPSAAAAAIAAALRRGGDYSSGAGAGDGRGREPLGGGRGGVSLDEKVVARTLDCLEKLCRSEECERFMTPLAREVRFFLTCK